MISVSSALLAGRAARTALLVASASCGASLAACSAGPVDYARPYPVDKGPSSELNVQVFRENDRIRLTNTSAVEFGPSTLWANAAYSRPIDGLRVGESIELSLHEFRNEYSQPFRAGGFFATELPWSLVLTEIESGERLYSFIVVEDVTD